MSYKSRVVLTGGGTAGHVTLNLALLPHILKDEYAVHYIGSNNIECEMMSGQEGVVFHTISSGKLRRYFSFQNMIDVFKVGFGVLQCLVILIRLKPEGVFSKGGYVAVPVCIAAAVLGIPVVSHESDLTPGLANKIIAKFASIIFTSFEETVKHFPKGKSKCVGSPIRKTLMEGRREEGFSLTRLNGQGLPVLLIMGGSLGAQKLNQAVKETMKTLLKSFQIVHLTGKGKKVFDKDPSGYRSFEFVGEGLEHIFAIADIVVSRAGANSIFEFLVLRKPMLLIPLSAGSRGDQIENAALFAEKGWAEVLSEGELTSQTFLAGVQDTYALRDEMRSHQDKQPKTYELNELWSLIKSYF